MSIIASRPVRSTDRLIDAPTLPALPAQRPAADNTGRFPLNTSRPARGVAAVDTAAADRALIERAMRNNLEGVRRLADEIRARMLGERSTAPHPHWCPTDHTGEVTEFEGFTIGTLHERMLAVVTGDHAAWTDKRATASVYVERSDEAGEIVTPTRLVVCIAEGSESHTHGAQDTEAWTGTPEQARAFAAALLAGADLVEADAR